MGANQPLTKLKEATKQKKLQHPREYTIHMWMIKRLPSETIKYLLHFYNNNKTNELTLL